MILNTKKELVNLKGEPIKEADNTPVTLGYALSNILLTNDAGGKMKLFILAKKCFESKTVDLDASDLNLVKEAVKTTKIYNALIAGQIELILEDAKEDKQK